MEKQIYFTNESIVHWITDTFLPSLSLYYSLNKWICVFILHISYTTYYIYTVCIRIRVCLCIPPASWLALVWNGHKHNPRWQEGLLQKCTDIWSCAFNGIWFEFYVLDVATVAGHLTSASHRAWKATLVPNSKPINPFSASHVNLLM